MLSRHCTAKVDGLSNFELVFCFCLTSEQVLVLNTNFEYFLIDLRAGKGQDCAITKGRLPEKAKTSNSIPPYTLWMDYIPEGKLVYTSLESRSVKVVDLLASEQIDEFQLPAEVSLERHTFDGHFVRRLLRSNCLLAVYALDEDFVVCKSEPLANQLRVVGRIPIGTCSGGFLVERWDDFFVFGRQNCQGERLDLCFAKKESLGTIRAPLPTGAIVVKYLMLSENDILVLYNADNGCFGGLLLHLESDQIKKGGAIEIPRGSELAREIVLLAGKPQIGTLSSEAFFDPVQKDLWLLEFGAIHKCKVAKNEGLIVFENCSSLELEESFDSDREVVTSAAVSGHAFMRCTLDYESESLDIRIFVSPCRRTQYFWLLTHIAGDNQLLPPDMVEVIDLLL